MSDELCKETVYPNDQYGSFHPHRCQKKAVKDGYCKIHHPDYVKIKKAERSAKWEAQYEEKKKAWTLQFAAKDLLEACEKAKWLFDQLALSPLEAAAKYGDSYLFPTDEECLEVREMLENAIKKARR